MSKKVYKDKETAKRACEMYMNELKKMQIKYDVWEDIDEAKENILVHTEYINDDGKHEMYTYLEPSITTK
jgi:hypothetical protein